jgi:hypothetical protein
MTWLYSARQESINTEKILEPIGKYTPRECWEYTRISVTLYRIRWSEMSLKILVNI